MASVSDLALAALAVPTGPIIVPKRAATEFELAPLVAVSGEAMLLRCCELICLLSSEMVEGEDVTDLSDPGPLLDRYNDAAAWLLGWPFNFPIWVVGSSNAACWDDDPPFDWLLFSRFSRFALNRL